tara:strand:+ start:38 stop:292 length:255 start_codon:yes stop_codon:yes gene_type:complete
MSSKKSKSIRLRKYGSAFKKYAKDSSEPFQKKEEEKKERKEKKKKDLNDYQEFFKKESRKEKYKHLHGKERMERISKSWKKLKK